MSSDEVLVIGAGPFGLSIAAHLRALGVDHRIVGRPMDTWRAHMPPGMKLRSEPYGSDMASPQAGYDVEAYSRLHGLDYVERLGPLSIERFLDYADWYIESLAPDVDDVTVTDVAAVDGGFRVSYAGEPSTVARQVVVATGVLPYAVLPDELSGLPADLVTHTADHHDLSRFRGRRVAVVGGGQSALETAALLHEAGADTRVVMRRPAAAWLVPNPAKLSRLGHVRRPVNKLCEGWHCAFWNSPAAFRRLPRDLRITKARTVLGPAGAWWLKDRIDGVVDVLADRQLRGAEPVESGIRLHLEGASHRRRSTSTTSSPGPAFAWTSPGCRSCPKGSGPASRRSTGTRSSTGPVSRRCAVSTSPVRRPRSASARPCGSSPGRTTAPVRRPDH